MSRADGDGGIGLRGRHLRVGLASAAGLADTGPSFEKREFSARKTTIMHELVAHGATGPAPAEHGFIPIQPLLADFTIAGLDGEQHRLPVSARFPDAHGTAV